MSACSFYILYEASLAPSSPRVTFRHGARSGRIYPNWSDVEAETVAVAWGLARGACGPGGRAAPLPSEPSKASFRPHFC